ncbi:MAG: hypothetical protein K2O01_04580 [Bacteroidales bacterium]|nr:hypothetical protein [Bacteroidales bacterium]
MKKVFALLTAPLMLAGLLTSCKPEQSELNLETLPGSATVTGKVEYNPGVTNIDGVLVRDFKKPAAGRTVEVKVFTASYTNPYEEDFSGNYRTFRATTDEKGRYSVSLPVGHQAITAHVTALPFIDEVNVLDHDKNIIPVENAVYKNDMGSLGESVSLSDQSIEEVDFLMVTTKNAEDFALNQKVSLKGRVLVPAEVRRETGLSDTLLPYATELRVRITVGETTMRYETVSDAKGQYSLDMLLPNNCWDVYTTITVEKQRVIGDFTHYYRKNGTTNWRSETVQTFIEGKTASLQLTADHKLIPVSMFDLELDVNPVYPENVHGIGNSIDTEDDIEFNNPLNW